MLKFITRQRLILSLFLTIGITFSVIAERVYSAMPSISTGVQVQSAPRPIPGATQPQPVGQVVWVKGSVKDISESNVSRALERRGVVFEKDTIVTDATGSGEVVFSDNTILSVNPNTQIKVDQYKYTHGASPSQDKYFVSIAKGGFRTITGAIAKSNPTNYQVNTPVATIGVRGTQWAIEINGIKINVKIERGSIQITTPKGKAVLDKDKDKLYAVIDFNDPMPMIVNTPPPGAFSNEPPLTPATSTLQTSYTGSSSNTQLLPGATTTSGGGGGGGGGSMTGPGGSAPSQPQTGFCIQ